MKILNSSPCGSAGMNSAVMMPLSSVGRPPKAGKAHGLVISMGLQKGDALPFKVGTFTGQITGES